MKRRFWQRPAETGASPAARRQLGRRAAFKLVFWGGGMLRALGAGGGAAEPEAARWVPDITPCAFAHYSFGTAVDSAGFVWFTEFNRRRVRGWNPQTGQFAAGSAAEVPGLYGLAAGLSGELFAGLDLGDVGSPGKIVRWSGDGAATPLHEKITRPRQLCGDAAGHLYAVLEGGQVLRWDRATGAVAEVFCAQSPLCGIAVGPDGSIYVSEYGVFDVAPEGYSRPLTPGQVKVRRPTGEVAVLAKGFWRARGLALQGSNLYLCTESNRADHGNAGLLVRIDSATGVAETLLDDLDYPQFPAASAAGPVYFTLGRDNRLVSYDAAAPFREGEAPPRGGAKSRVRGGRLVWEESGAGIGFALRAQKCVLRGRLLPDAGVRRMDGWLEIPAERFALNREDLYPVHDAEHPGPGLFELPEVAWSSAAGALRGEVFPRRAHEGCRWPMREVGTRLEAPAAGFSEQPVAFRFYFCWTAGS